MDADLKNHINKGFKTFEVFSKLKDFVDDIDAVESQVSEQKKYILNAQAEIDLLVRKQVEAKEVIKNIEDSGALIIEEAKREALEIVEKAKNQKNEIAKKEKAESEKAKYKITELQKEIDLLSKEIVPLRHERDTIVSEIETVKDKFRKMI